MTSFQIAVSPSRRAAGRFVSRVRRALQRALVEEGEHNGITQSEIARSIDVHRSVISRELNGRQDITLGRVAELAWALGRDIEFELVERETPEGSNVAVVPPGALDVRSEPLPGTQIAPSPASRTLSSASSQWMMVPA